MKGIIIIYQTNSSLESTTNYYKIIGRVAVKRNGDNVRYIYHKGMLHSKKFCWLGKGCLFIKNGENLNFDKYKVSTTIVNDIDFKDKDLYTAREYFLNKYGKVVNIG